MEDECEDGFDPNEFVKSHDQFMRYIAGLINNNGSEEINEEGAPMFRNYGRMTIRTLSFILAQSSAIMVMAPQVFLLNQGDISEEQFHSKVQELIEKL